MSISWGNLSVRVYAAEAWVNLAPRFAAARPEIVDEIERALDDEEPAVRLQAAGNLQVICEAAPDRMWELGARIAARERNDEVLVAYLSRSLRRFSHGETERCESILQIAKGRLGDFEDREGARDRLQECLGSWAAQLQAGQGRTLAREWLEEWSADPARFQYALNAYSSCLRGTFFSRYGAEPEKEAEAMCDRAQEGLTMILTPALGISAASHAVLHSDVSDEDKRAAGKRYSAAEHVIHHAMNQLYFGAGARADDAEGGPGLNNVKVKARFLTDYAEILALLSQSREPATLHHLIELYEHLIPGDPIAVFTAFHAILTGIGAEEGYQFESLGSTAVVKIVKRYIADHRGIFDDQVRRSKLVEILQLFSEVGWTEALRLLYDLPDLLR
ncbi:hypothetical protein [Sphingomonas sp. NIC1]|uniref:hypothetical protein n=1 Tax=Sphingomonas sp. NIC1 TaxID=1961362 RepID=UPI0007C0E19C|nr:hypothetical protein [Sphingomonas sp. NIC1]ANC86669.1 hypothetical protein A7E77_07045 [Sphingomonas sp. NIC1]